jgi:hypothetical protein
MILFQQHEVKQVFDSHEAARDFTSKAPVHEPGNELLAGLVGRNGTLSNCGTTYVKSCQ